MNIGKEIAILHGMTIRELREKHLEVFGDPTRAGHKQYLIRRIAWRMQSLAEGDLSDRALRRPANGVLWTSPSLLEWLTNPLFSLYHYSHMAIV
jgi:hypothetical protein